MTGVDTINPGMNQSHMEHDEESITQNQTNSDTKKRQLSYIMQWIIFGILCIIIILSILLAVGVFDTETDREDTDYVFRPYTENEDGFVKYIRDTYSLNND